MIFKYILVFVMLFCILGLDAKLNSPPHCTQVTKDSDYISRYKMDYPVAYIHPGQKEAFQKLFCIDPAAVNKGVALVCDWAAPPQVQFTMGDEYMHVVRQDPAGQYPGNAVIKTYQICNHTTHLYRQSDIVVTETDGFE
ncbi:uncharacterized protein LOC110997501 [Pieris rapae]|uniref:uncharacterized protein LOC110997501 n=1 Tax=Pieris rapae TaxID=64459 RepID=UPI001E27DF88|nr:uncharacterized protein LOC110997501 [Pieris rapae]